MLNDTKTTNSANTTHIQNGYAVHSDGVPRTGESSNSMAPINAAPLNRNSYSGHHLTTVGLVFERPSSNTAPQVPNLSAAAREGIEAPLAKIEPCESTIRCNVYLADEEAVTAVSKFAADQFASEPTRNNRRSWAKKVIAAIPELIKNESFVRERWIDANNHSECLQKINVAEQKIFTVANLPDITQFIFWLAMFGYILVSEIRNGIFLAQMGVEEFKNDPVGAACFCASFMIGAFVVNKGCFIGMNGRHRAGLIRVYKRLSVPIAFIAILLFAYKMGSSWEPNIGFELPFWVMTLFSMLSLILGLVFIPMFLSIIVDKIWKYRIEEGEVFISSGTRLRDANYVFAEVAALQQQMQLIEAQLDKEQAGFVAASVAKLRKFQGEFAFLQAQQRLKVMSGEDFGAAD